MNLKYPWLLLLFLCYIPLIYFYIKRLKNSTPSIEVSTLTPFNGHAPGWRVKSRHFCFVLRLLSIGALIIVICRPQTFDNKNSASVEGTDIVVALDVSGSMESPDLVPTRYDAAKKMASNFVEKRKNDNIGLVGFAGESLTLLPLTVDKAAVLNAISNLRLGSLGDGTAIGDGLVSAINRVLGGNAVSKSVILLTDGTNNTGEIDPMTAAQIAKQKGVRVYTIAVGRDAVVPVSSMFGHITTQIPVEVDEKTLSSIAGLTNGKFYRATDNTALQQVFDDIDQLEKSKLTVENYSRTDENFMMWLLVAAGLFVLEIVLRYTLFRRIP